MSELLQDDDPDPQPSAERVYPINYETGLAYEDDGLATELAYLQEIEDTARLSAVAARLLEDERTEGPQRERILRQGDVFLRRQISDGNWFYFFQEERGRCRAWNLGGAGVSWCEDLQRYEPALDVLERLEQAFEPAEVASLPFGQRMRSIAKRLGKLSVATITPRH